MLWNKTNRSENVKDQRKDKDVRSATGKILASGLVASVLAGSAAYWTGFVTTGNVHTTAVPASQQVAALAPLIKDDPHRAFIEVVLGSTEEVWTDLFEEKGVQYKPPELVLYNSKITTVCGRVSANEHGPVYCPEDRQIYIDPQSLTELATQSSTVSDFAQAYVIAHEVAHHVQQLLGVTKSVDDAQSEGEPITGKNGPSVRRELQADCLAGVWARETQAQFDWLEPGDIEEALTLATTFGDDALKVPVKDYSHGTSEQRVEWFNLGFTDSDANCDTFDGRPL